MRCSRRSTGCRHDAIDQWGGAFTLTRLELAVRGVPPQIRSQLRSGSGSGVSLSFIELQRLTCALPLEPTYFFAHPA